MYKVKRIGAKIQTLNRLRSKSSPNYSADEMREFKEKFWELERTGISGTFGFGRNKTRSFGVQQLSHGVQIAVIVCCGMRAGPLKKGDSFGVET